jgi:hypothetical protein
MDSQMGDIRLYLGTMVLMFSEWSCQEVYHPGDIESAMQIPVIQGVIAENKAPVVSLSWAAPYLGQSVDNPISGASVWITDDQGNQVDLSETSPGRYTVDTAVCKGRAGRTYTLGVELPDGNQFSSAAEKIGTAPILDSLFAKIGTRVVYSTGEFNNVIAETQNGLYILADLHAEGNAVQYYHLNTQVLTETVVVKGLNSPNTISVYNWQTSDLDEFYSVAYTVPHNVGQILPEYTAGFLRYYYDNSLETLTTSAPYTVGWIVTFSVYSLSSDAYLYYKSIGDQLGSNNQIFSPVPSQVKSNVHCDNDPSLPVIGIFEANTLIRVYKAFAWVSKSTYREMDLSSFPDNVYNGSKEGIPPSFWISF